MGRVLQLVFKTMTQIISQKQKPIKKVLMFQIFAIQLRQDEAFEWKCRCLSFVQRHIARVNNSTKYSNIHVNKCRLSKTN